jgi:hypothetical protein
MGKSKNIIDDEAILNQKKINHIVHYNDNFEIVLKILKNGFTPSYCDEKIGDFEYYIPMVSFCNIPLRDTNHYMRYGKHGIGMSLNWALRNSISPVVYIHETTPFKNFHSEINKIHLYDIANKILAGKVKEITENIKDETDYSTYDELLNRINRITVTTIQFSKNWKTTYKQNEIITYQEREWRYIPDLINSNEKRIITEVEEEFNLLKKKKFRPKPHLPEYTLKIDLIEDLKYIIIKTDDQRNKIINILINKFGDKELKNSILTGNLLIIKEEIIHNDF